MVDNFTSEKVKTFVPISNLELGFVQISCNISVLNQKNTFQATHFFIFQRNLVVCKFSAPTSAISAHQIPLREVETSIRHLALSVFCQVLRRVQFASAG